jgi:RNA polymerase sigma factor (sigma-70 family)
VADELTHREQDLRALIDAHGQTVRVVLSRVERDREDVNELWADVFQVAFLRLDDLSQLSEGQQRGWLIRTAGNLAANHARRRTSWRRMLERVLREPMEPSTSPEDTALEAEQRAEEDATSAAIRAALVQLRVVDRQVLVLDALGHDGPSIGRELGISPGAARKRLMVARIAFRQQFRVPADEPAQSRTQP